MLQVRADSLSFTQAALCGFNLSRVAGKSIETEGVGGRDDLFFLLAAAEQLHIFLVNSCGSYTLQR